MRVPAGVILMFSAAASAAQSGLQPGTFLSVQPGTTLRFEGPQVFGIPASAGVQNDGVIEFDEQASLIETPGHPITGAGVERTTRDFPLPMAGADPAGLGFAISTTAAPGLLTLTRGHLPVIDNGGLQSVARWYDVGAVNNSGLGASVTMHYDPAELNGLNEATLTLHVEGAGNLWSAFPSLVDLIGHAVDVNGMDSLGRFTLFDTISTQVDETGAGQEIFLLPTVATDALTVIAPGLERGNLALRDATGRVVMQRTVRGDRHRIDVSTLSPGRYLLSLDGVYAGSFVKP